MSELWKIWEARAPWKIPETQYTLRGYSVAALRTNFYIKELKVMLDAGLSANYAPRHIFITHGHSDHAANIHYHLYAEQEDKTMIYAPAPVAHLVDAHICSAHAMSTFTRKESKVPKSEETEEPEDVEETRDSSTDPKAEVKLEVKPEAKAEPVKMDPKSVPGNRYWMVPARAGQRWRISEKPVIEVEVIRCYHSVPCVGYGFTERRTKLKDEYTGLEGKEIAALVKSGVAVSREVEIPFLLYLGDTSERVLADPAILKYKTVMIECTFILEDDLAQAKATKHMHASQLIPFIKAHPEINFVLYHFSQRYKADEIAAFFAALDLKNVTLWIS
jgi:ribonuclease Z